MLSSACQLLSYFPEIKWEMEIKIRGGRERCGCGGKYCKNAANVVHHRGGLMDGGTDRFL